MRPAVQDHRCSRCCILLARQLGKQITIRRGDMQIVVEGTFRLTVSCYRCGQQNLFVDRPRAPGDCGFA
jgi:RNase P subunit RPR2